MQVFAILPAAGLGTRMAGPQPKQFLALHGRQEIAMRIGLPAVRSLQWIGFMERIGSICRRTAWLGRVLSRSATL